MSSDDLFTLIWAPISIVIGAIGGYIIYRRAKQAEERSKTKNKKG